MVPLLDLPHGEARRLAQSGATVYLSVNPVEFHGPHLSLHNDRLVSLGLARDLHARLEPESPFLLGADLEVGVDPCPGPGSRHTPYRIVRALVVEACRALTELGAKRVVLMTFHGAPLHAHAIEAGVRELRRRGVIAVAPFNLVIQELLDLKLEAYGEILAPIADPAERALVAAEFGLDFHAGFGETSVALHYAPESVSPKFATLPPCAPLAPPRTMLALAHFARWMGARRFGAELGFAASAMAWYALRPFPGYTTRPHLANATSGAAFAKLILDHYERHTREVFAGRSVSPAPIMPWIGLATLGGRVGKLTIPESEVKRLASVNG